MLTYFLLLNVEHTNLLFRDSVHCSIVLLKSNIFIFGTFPGIETYTSIQTLGLIYIYFFLHFVKKMRAALFLIIHCWNIIKIQNTVFYLIYFKIHLFLWSKAEFQHHYFSVTWSSEIILICWFAAQETFLILSILKNSLCCLFLWKFIYFVFQILW